MANNVYKDWTELPCGYSYKWGGEEGRLSDCSTEEHIPQDQVLAEIKADCGLDLYYHESCWGGAYGESDTTVKLFLKDWQEQQV